MTYDIDEDIDLEERTLAHIWQRRLSVDSGPFLWTPGEERLAAHDLQELCLAAAGNLVALGVGHGERVCLFMPSDIKLLSIMLALWQIGAVVVPISAHLQGDLLEDQIARSACTLVLANAELGSVLSQRQIAFVERDDVLRPPQHVDASLLSGRAKVPSFGDPAMIMYTSGSTGPSKGCLLSHHMCVYYAWVFWRYMGYEKSDVIHTCLPLNHNHALFASFFPAVLAGAGFALSPKFSASRYWDEVVESGATTVSAIGPMASILMGQVIGENETRHKVRLAHIAPAPSRVDEYQQRFGLKVVSALYGATEAMVFPPDRFSEPVRDLIGKAPRDWDVAIVDEQGTELPVGVTGELVARPRRAKIIFDGYFGMPDATVRAWRDLWYHSGDRCRVDHDGNYWFVGRAKEVVRRRGENISMWEVETTLGKHLEVAEIAAVAIPLDDGDEQLAVVVRPAEGSRLTSAMIGAWCEADLPRHMRPDHVVVVERELPRTHSGKIDREQVTAAAQAELGAQGPD